MATSEWEMAMSKSILGGVGSENILERLFPQIPSQLSICKI
jgi:hypothetical protein